MFLFLLLYNAKCENKDFLTEKDVELFDTIEFNLSKDEIQEIEIDQHFFTAVFSPSKVATVEVLIEENNKKYSIGDISFSNGRFGFHCVDKFCSFRIKSKSETTMKMHIYYDSIKCDQTFISTKTKENFVLLQESDDINITNETFCFFHFPNENGKFVLKSEGNIKTTYSTPDKELVQIQNGEKKTVFGEIHNSIFVTISNKGMNISKDTFYFSYSSEYSSSHQKITEDLQNTTDNSMKHIKYTEGFNLNYNFNDSSFFLNKIGKEEIDLNLIESEIDAKKATNNDIDSTENQNNYEDEYEDDYNDDDNNEDSNDNQNELHNSSKLKEYIMKIKDLFHNIAKINIPLQLLIALLVAFFFISMTIFVTFLCINRIKQNNNQEFEAFVSNQQSQPMIPIYSNQMPITFQPLQTILIS